MNNDKELKRLKGLLRTHRLSFSERLAIEAKIRDIENPDFEAVRWSMPGVFGVFDRPEPGKANSSPEKTEAGGEGKSHAQVAPEPQTTESVPPRSAAELDALAERIFNIADHIARLRRFWATTLAPEVDRDAELWLAKLHELTKDLPREIAELILDDRAYLLTQQPREVKKPAISETTQYLLIAPSAPSLDLFGTMSEVYYAVHERRRAPSPQHPPGYVPDGLQQFV